MRHPIVAVVSSGAFLRCVNQPLAWVLRPIIQNLPMDQKWRNDETETRQAVPGKRVPERSLGVSDSGVCKIGLAALIIPAGLQGLTPKY
jgi:hypothetical protein